MHRLARLHGADVLATTVVQTCVRYREPERCRYCSIEESLASGAATRVKTPAQLAEVASAAVELDGVRQMVMTTGTAATADRGARHLARCVTAGHGRGPVPPIQVQCEPPEPRCIDALHAAGADAIGIHVESLDDAVRRRWMPGKATVPLGAVLGRLGTTPWRFSEPTGCPPTCSSASARTPTSSSPAPTALIEHGVYPFVVPVRPGPGTLAAADGLTAHTRRWSQLSPRPSAGPSSPPPCSRPGRAPGVRPAGRAAPCPRRRPPRCPCCCRRVGREGNVSGELAIAVVADHFDRDLDRCWDTIGRHLAEARAAGARLVVLPEACLGGYLLDLHGAGDDGGLPPALDPDGPEVARLAAMAGDLVVCAGYCEDGGTERFNAAVCVHDGRVLGRHRKVHQPLGEHRSYAAGDHFGAFDTPVGRLGMQICYDKAFPEAARAAALDGATVIASLSAWPASRTDPAPVLAEDRWTRRFDLFDQARALENQVVWAAANQAGRFGNMQFVGRAKVVGPGGDVLASTGTSAGTAVARVDVEAVVGQARRAMFHLRDRRPDAYPGRDGAVLAGTAVGAP